MVCITTGITRSLSAVLGFVALCSFPGAMAWAGVADITASNNQIRVDYISTRVSYTETANDTTGPQPEVLDAERGTVRGRAFGVSVMTNSGLYVEGQYSRNNGYTNYTGSSMAGGAYGSITGMSSAYIVDYAVRVGSGSDVDGSAMLTPYAEVGRHEWDRGVNFGEVYTHNYLGGGVMGQYSPASGLVMTGTALIGETFGARISVAGPLGFSDRLGSSFIYRAGVLVDYAFLRNFHGHIGFDYTSFKYGKSGVNKAVVGGTTYYVWEPDSNTNYTTFRIGLGYAF